MTRTFTLPGTDDERCRLVEALSVMCAARFGYPTRQANLARWQQMPMGELRQVHARWRQLMQCRERHETTQKPDPA